MQLFLYESQILSDLTLYIIILCRYSKSIKPLSMTLCKQNNSAVTILQCTTVHATHTHACTQTMCSLLE